MAELGVESLLSAVLDDLTALVSRLDSDLNVLFANRAYIQEFAPDASLEKLQGKNILQFFINEDDQKAFVNGLARLSPEQPVYKSQLREKRSDGTTRTYLWTNRALYDDSNNLVGYQAVGQDVTAEVESRDALTAILSGAPDGIVEFDHNWRLIVCNQAAAFLFDWQLPQEMPDNGLLELKHLNSNEVQSLTQLIQDNFDQVLNTRSELTGYKTDDTSFPVEIGLVTAGTIDAVRYVAFLRDLTEQRNLFEEIDRQRKVVAQTEKMSALGSLLSNVAHELNNPLSVVVTQAELLADKAENEPTLKRASKIKRAASRCGDIVRTFLAIARQGPAHKENFRAESAVQESVALVEHALETSGITLNLQIDDDLAPLYGDPVQIGQVLSNLLVNSQQALMEQDGARKIQFSVDQDNNMINFRVADNGPGVSAELRDRIFEPFFTTKPMGDGTGIGLAIARSIAIAHGGDLTLTESPLGGASFTLSLPPTQAVEATETPVDQAANSSTEDKTILVVDDEADVADSLAELLSDAGFNTVIAIGGLAAISALESQRFDAIISDIRMPDMDGAKLYAEICKRWPDLADRFGVITGDMLNPTAHRFLQEGTMPRMEKPFTRESVMHLTKQLF